MKSNILKRFLSIAIIAAMVLTLSFGLTSCRGENELLFTIEGVEITSAIYIALLINADSEFMNNVHAAAVEEAIENDENPQNVNVNFDRARYEGLRRRDWVNKRALELAQIFAFVRTELERLDIEITEEEQNGINNFAAQNWVQGGGAQVFEPNGVDFNAFLAVTSTNAYMSIIFDRTYGEDGTNPISREELVKALGENYILIEAVSANLEAIEEEGGENGEEYAERVKTLLESFVDRLNDGEEFSIIFEEFNAYLEALFADDDEEEDDEDDEDDEDEGESRPDYEHIIGGPDSHNPSNIFEDLEELEINEVGLIEIDDDVFVLARRLDITQIDYYIEENDAQLRSLIHWEDFSEDIEEQALELEVVRIRSARAYHTGRLDYPQQ